MRLIDADALKNTVIDNFDNLQAYFPKDFIEEIDNAPTVEPCYQTTSCLDCKNYDKEIHNCPRYCEVIKEAIKSRPQGEWKLDSLGAYCSKCGTHPDYSSNFCPNCGAKMKGGAEE